MGTRIYLHHFYLKFLFSAIGSTAVLKYHEASQLDNRQRRIRYFNWSESWQNKKKLWEVLQLFPSSVTTNLKVIIHRWRRNWNSWDTPNSTNVPQEPMRTRSQWAPVFTSTLSTAQPLLWDHGTRLLSRTQLGFLWEGFVLPSDRNADSKLPQQDILREN